MGIAAERDRPPLAAARPAAHDCRYGKRAEAGLDDAQRAPSTLAEPIAVRPGGHASLDAEIAFLTAFGLEAETLVTAVGQAQVVGVTADRALLAAGLLSAEQFYRLLAIYLGVPFLHPALPVAEGVAIDGAMEIEIVPLAPNARGIDFVAAPRGRTLARLLERFSPDSDRPSPRVAITTPQRIAALVRHRHRGTIVRDASYGLSDWDPRLSALAGWTVGQRAFGFGAAATAAWGLATEPVATSAALCLALSALFLGLVVLRLLAMAASLLPGDRRPAIHLRDDQLPNYTIVVPLFREARVVPRLTMALRRLDYPAARLDIKLVLEADDFETLEAVQAERLPDCFEILLAPAGRPRTKPRALNVALRFARGDLLVIYDAEDDPEPGQLREAASMFAGAGPSLGCVQARLAIDNETESWLTRLFALEYAALFDVVNPGLARLGLPIPLGGTSNHFRIEVLHRLNGWDAWNVTEDIDLGIRLARFGYRIGVLRSTTFEEAPHTLRAWLGQRQRWQKGWIVTLKTHSRSPARLLGQAGVRGGLCVLVILCGTILSSLLWPFFALALASDAASGALLHPVTLSERAWSHLALTLGLLGLASLLGPLVLGVVRRRRLLASAAYLPLLPAYLALLTAATWIALLAMLTRPYEWTKTEHGVAKRRVRRS